MATASSSRPEVSGSLSIVASELSHAVVTATVDLRFSGQSGALLIHFSDVFAALAEQWQKQTADEASWLIGTDVPVKGVALRSMRAPGTAYDNPELGNPQPDHMSKFVKTADEPGDDFGGVHINSGIPNKAFFLVATRIGGNAWERAGRIWYESMPNMKEDTTFDDFARITYDVARELYGKGSREREAVRRGWEAVGISVEKGGRP